MISNAYRFFAATILVFGGLACSTSDAQKNTPPVTNASSTTAADAKPQATPSNKFTVADVTKLKWIEGTWRGMDGDKPFYERYKIEENAMVVETLKEDGSLDGEPGRFELKNGEFGKTEGDSSSAASEITDTSVQFVSAVPGKGNSFRFVKQPHGWDAILEWAATANRPAGQKMYRMEPWSPPKK